MMRILIFIPKGYPKLGGSEIVGGLLARRFVERGHSVSILAPRQGPQPADETVDGIPVRRCGSGLPPQQRSVWAGVLLPFARSAACGLLRHDVALSIGCNRSVALGCSLARALKRPWVVKLQTGGPEGDLATLRRTRGGERIVRRVALRASHFAAISEETCRELLDCGVGPARIARIPNCVDTQRYLPLEPLRRDELKSRLGIAGRRLVVAGGRMVPRKRLDLALAAFARSSADAPDLLLCVAGDGPLRADLESQAAREGLAGRVRFLGPVPDMSPWLQAADLYLHTADSEGLPLAILEAMSAGAAVAASRIGGIVDLIEDGRTGFLFEAGSIDAAARALSRALSADATGIRRAARARIEADFSLDRVAGRYLELFGMLTGKGGKQLR